jgi:hypothetical protein
VIVTPVAESMLSQLDLDLLDEQIHHLHTLEEQVEADTVSSALSGLLNFLCPLYRALADANGHKSKYAEES